MNRRGFVKSVMGAAASAAVPAVMRGALDPARQRPNILWVVTEDNTYNYNGPYGDPRAHTPHVDRLASQGVVFENCHSNAPVCAPSRSTIITGRYASSMGTQHMRSNRPLPPGVKFFPEYLRAEGYFCTNHLKTDYNTSSSFAAAWDLCNGRAHWRQRQPGQPFFAVFNFLESHESHLFERQPLLTDPARVKVPQYLPDTPETRADLAQYFDCVGRADASLGRILDQLEQDGLSDSTIVFYYSDHGGSLPRSKRFLYDNGTHTPMVVRFPRDFAHLAPSGPGTRSTEMLSYVDLAPTVLSLAGVPAPAYFQGRAFAGAARQPAPATVYSFRGRMDERYDLSTAVSDGRFRYIRNYMPDRPAGQHLAYLWNEASMKRFDQLHRQKQLGPLAAAFFQPRAPEELFDCSVDPENVRNLAADLEFRPDLERLRRANRDQVEKARDTGFLPEAMMVAEAGPGSPQILAMNRERYPLERLLELVDSSQIGRAHPAIIEAALSDPLPIVRYWGVRCALPREDAPDLKPLLDDPDPSVRVAAAEAVLRRGAEPAAWNRLQEALALNQPRELRLAALNALAFLPAAPAEVAQHLRTIAGNVGEASARPTVPVVAPPVRAASDEAQGDWAENGWKTYGPQAAQYLLERMGVS